MEKSSRTTKKDKSLTSLSLLWVKTPVTESQLAVVVRYACKDYGQCVVETTTDGKFKVLHIKTLVEVEPEWVAKLRPLNWKRSIAGDAAKSLEIAVVPLTRKTLLKTRSEHDKLPRMWERAWFWRSWETRNVGFWCYLSSRYSSFQLSKGNRIPFLFWKTFSVVSH